MLDSLRGSIQDEYKGLMADVQFLQEAIEVYVHTRLSLVV